MTGGPPYSRTLYIVFYSTILIIGTIGNVLVIVVIVKLKEMRNSTNIFLANLAIADLILLVTWGAITLYGIISGRNLPDLNKGVCYAQPVVWAALGYVPVLTTLAVSFERYYAICQPLKAAYICTKSRAFKSCLLIWAIAALFGSTRLLFIIYQPKNGRCVERRLFWRNSYHITIVSVFFILPIVILVVLYIIIAQHLKQAVASSVNISAMRHHRRILKMVAAVVFCFFVCQTPLRVRTLLVTSVGYRELVMWMGQERFSDLALISTMVLYLHSAMNPILYHVMSERFRAAFKSVFCDSMHGCKRRRRSSSSRTSTINNITAAPTNTSSA